MLASTSPGCSTCPCSLRLCRRPALAAKTRVSGSAWIPALVGALLIAESFWVEVYVSLRGGLLARGLVTLFLLLVVAEIWRRPTVPGWHR